MAMPGQFRDARPQSHGTNFYYLKGSRSGEIPRAQLGHFKGAVQTDEYKLYDYFESMPGVIPQACMVTHQAQVHRRPKEPSPLCGARIHCHIIHAGGELQELRGFRGGNP